MPLPARSTLRYRPLSVARNDIRILLLESGASIHGEIQCRIEHVPLLAASNYVALSYSGGKTSKLVPIRVNGHTFYITPNLSGALTELRRRGYTRVWADAICINQADNEERSRQVLRMPDVYSSASAVIAWLGTASFETIDGVLDLADSIEELLRFNDRKDQYQSLGRPHKGDPEVLTTKAQFDDTRTPEGQALRQRGLRRVVRGVRNFMDDKPLKNPHPMQTTKDAVQYLLKNLKNADWKPLGKLLSCEYWSQVNIIQQLSLANRLEMIWGQQIFTFLDICHLVAAYRIMRKANLISNMIPASACQQIQNLLNFKDRHGQLEVVPLVRALQMTSTSKSPDPRDKVYGLIGLTKDGSSIFPMPSYSREVRDLNEEATLSIIKLENSIDYVVFRSREPGSWPVDWFSSTTWSDPRIVSYLGRASRFHLRDAIYTKWSATKPVHTHIRVRNGHLVIKGSIIDSIRSCSATLHERHSKSKPLPVYKPRENAPQGERLDYSKLSRQIFMCFYLLREEQKKILTESEFYTSIQFMLAELMYGRGEKDNSDEIGKVILEWLDCSMNTSFTIGGSSLSEWIGARTPNWLDTVNLEKRINAPIAASAIKKTLQMGMRLGRTMRVRVGWFTKHARPGDVIALLDGCTVPAVLRFKSDGSYVVVGDCIIPSIMLGEADHHARSEIWLR